MSDDFIDIIRAGGRVATPIAVASWGIYVLPMSINYPQPYSIFIPWVCCVSIIIGAVVSWIIAIQELGYPWATKKRKSSAANTKPKPG